MVLPGWLDNLWSEIRAPSFSAGILIGAAIAFIMSILKKQIEASALTLLSKVPSAISGRIGFRLWERRYRRVIANQHKYIRLAGMRQQFEVPPPRLEDVFVDLELQQPANPTSGGPLQPAFTLRDTFQIDSALTKFQHFVILGEPGSGKTTLLQHLVALAAKPKRESLSLRMFPIFVSLRSCFLNGRSLIEEITDPRTGILPADILTRYPRGFFEHRLENGNCLLLFDGMDEVLDENRHVAAARMIEASAVVYPRSKIIVTSRIAGWRNLLGSGFPRFVIRRLSLREIERLVTQWYLAVLLDRARSQVRALTEEISLRSRQQAVNLSRHVLSFLSESDRLMDIATTPLILSLMCLVYYVRHDLPERRVLLYEECCRVLLEDWDKVDKQLSPSLSLTYGQKNDLLERIATHLFQYSATEISRGNLLRVLEDWLHDSKLTLVAEDVLCHIEERSGLLAEKAIGKYGFTHLTFQEYFSAIGLLAVPEGLSRLLAKIQKQEGDEVALLFAGGAENGDEIVTAIRNIYLNNSSNIRLLLLAGKAAAESKNLSLDIKSNVIDHLTAEFDAARDDEHLVELQGVLHRLGVDRQIVRSFGDFMILDELGRGGFATTYTAREKSTSKILAIKVYNAGTAQYATQMAEEIARLRQLSHPALVKFLHAGVNRDQLFVAMELVSGLTLKSVQSELAFQFYMRRPNENSNVRVISAEEAALVEGWCLPGIDSDSYFNWAIELAKDIRDGLMALHDKGLLHGDLKPSNVLLFDNGHRVAAKISDYSVDVVVTRAMQPDYTVTRWSIPFTPNFSAPEIVRGPIIELTPRSDVYSMGVLIKDLLFLSTMSRTHVRNRPMRNDLIGTSRTFDQLVSSRGVEEVLRRATATNPADRFGSPGEFWIALEEQLRRAAVIGAPE